MSSGLVRDQRTEAAIPEDRERERGGDRNECKGLETMAREWKEGERAV